MISKSISKHYLLAMAMAAAAGMCDSSFQHLPVDNTPPYPEKKSLPKWDVGGHTIYAKNEKDALKYAKKRGLFEDGMQAVRID